MARWAAILNILLNGLHRVSHDTISNNIFYATQPYPNAFTRPQRESHYNSSVKKVTMCFVNQSLKRPPPFSTQPVMNLTQEDLCGNPSTTWFWEDSTINYRNYCRLPSSVLASRYFFQLIWRDVELLLISVKVKCQVWNHFMSSQGVNC